MGRQIPMAIILKRSKDNRILNKASRGIEGSGSFTIDISKTKLGEAIKSDRIDLPEGSRFGIADRDFTIATIVAPRGMTAEAQREANEGEGGDDAAAAAEEGTAEA